MGIIDRHVAGRFLGNFVILFAVLFVFAASIDVIVQIDRFLDAATAMVGRGEHSWKPFAFLATVFSFHGPRIFQFYAYLQGLIAVAAMGFTLAQMHRARELTALLACGRSLRRTAMPVILGACLLNVAQLANQEFILPRLAPLLLRDHGDLERVRAGGSPVPLTVDGSGMLLMAKEFVPDEQILRQLVAIERDPEGAARRRITADEAAWDESARAWRLTNGLAVSRSGGPRSGEELVTEDAALTRGAGVPVTTLETDLDPASLRLRESAQYAHMLSLRQIASLARENAVDSGLLGRARWARFAGIAINLLVLLLTLPSFLLREPANLLRQSVECAAIAVPAMLGALVATTIAVPGVQPILSVSLPIFILVPLALGRWVSLKT